METIRIVLVTAPNEEEAAKIAHLLIERRLAACVNIAPRVRSIYRWEEKTYDENESLMIIKTVKDRLPGLIAAVRKEHSYQTPEIIAFPITEGFGGYLDWVEQITAEPEV